MANAAFKGSLHSSDRLSQGTFIVDERWFMKRVLLSLMAGSIALMSMQGKAIAGEYSQSDLGEEISQRVSIPVLLPNESLVRQAIFDQSDPIYAYRSGGSGQGYHVTFSTIPNCDATACLRFSVGGTKGKAIDTELPRGASSEYVRLSDGSRALAKKQCGASCWGVVQWTSKGVLYEVWTKAQNYQAAIKIANSMVETGDRSKVLDKTVVDRSVDLVSVSNWEWSIFEDIRIPNPVMSKK